jgi:hypothetical protein
MATDKHCFGCKRRLAPQSSFAGGKPPMAQRFAMIGACLGACIAPLLVGYDPQPSGEGVDFSRAMWAGIGGAVGGTLGLAVGSLFTRRSA